MKQRQNNTKKHAEMGSKKNRRWVGVFSVKSLLLMLIPILIVLFIFLVSALTEQDKTALQEELDNLISSLNEQGYNWLVDYSGNDLDNSASIEVYRENDNEIIALFENVLEDKKYRILLDGLYGGVGLGNDTEDVFDLSSMGDVRKISRDIFQKKVRIDEIRKELNQEGGNV